jgi:hypothetical protein
MKDNKFKCYDELTQDNPNGLDTLPSPHNFSNNPGFLPAGGMGVAPSGTPGMSVGRIPVARGTAMRGTFKPNPTLGRSAISGPGSVANPAPGSTDPGQDGSPISVTTGFGG